MKVYKVEAYYSGWYEIDIYSTKKKAQARINKEMSTSKDTPRIGLMNFRIVERQVL